MGGENTGRESWNWRCSGNLVQKWKPPGIYEGEPSENLRLWSLNWTSVARGWLPMVKLDCIQLSCWLRGFPWKPVNKPRLILGQNHSQKPDNNGDPPGTTSTQHIECLETEPVGS